MTQLHWTINNTASHQKWDYEKELTTPLARALSSKPVSSSADHKFHRYLMLPNYWADWYPRNAFTMGSVTANRTRIDDGEWSYKVMHSNDQSGEHLNLNFACKDEPLRPLISPWNIRTSNSADSSYSGIDWTAQCQNAEGKLNVQLTTANGMSFVSGVCNPQNPTGFWALLDILPALAGDTVDDLCVLEDLQIPKLNCRIRPLEKWTFELQGGNHQLFGYSLQGEGLPPTYWWVTETGDVALIAMTFSTYVLVERDG